MTLCPGPRTYKFSILNETHGVSLLLVFSSPGRIHETIEIALKHRLLKEGVGRGEEGKECLACS